MLLCEGRLSLTGICQLKQNETKLQKKNHYELERDRALCSFAEKSTYETNNKVIIRIHDKKFRHYMVSRLLFSLFDYISLCD